MYLTLYVKGITDYLVQTPNQTLLNILLEYLCSISSSISNVTMFTLLFLECYIWLFGYSTISIATCVSILNAQTFIEKNAMQTVRC